MCVGPVWGLGRAREVRDAAGVGGFVCGAPWWGRASGVGVCLFS